MQKLSSRKHHTTGQGNEQDVLEPMIEETKGNFNKVGKEKKHLFQNKIVGRFRLSFRKEYADVV